MVITSDGFRPFVGGFGMRLLQSSLDLTLQKTKHIRFAAVVHDFLGLVKNLVSSKVLHPTGIGRLDRLLMCIAGAVLGGTHVFFNSLTANLQG